MPRPPLKLLWRDLRASLGSIVPVKLCIPKKFSLFHQNQLESLNITLLTLYMSNICTTLLNVIE